MAHRDRPDRRAAVGSQLVWRENPIELRPAMSCNGTWRMLSAFALGSCDSSCAVAGAASADKPRPSAAATSV